MKKARRITVVDESWKSSLTGTRRSSVVWAVLSLCAVLSVPPSHGLPKKKSTWIQIETAHFTLFSDANPKRVEAIGLDLERLRGLLEVMKTAGATTSPVPTTIYVFAGDRSFRPYKPRVNGKPASLDGFFQPHRYGNYVAINSAAGLDPRASIYHEYLHFIANNNFPGIPLWFNEGLAEFYSTFEIRGDEGHVGRPIEEHVLYLRQRGLLPLEQLLVIDESAPEYNEARRQGVFYAQSWAAVHYFMAGNQERTPQVIRYLDLLRAGTDGDEAFTEAFEADYATIHEELEDYVSETSFTYYRVPLEEFQIDTTTRVETLTRSQTLYRLGDLLAHMYPLRLAEAEEHFEAALAAEPENGLAWAGMGFVRELGGDQEGALELYERARSLRPDDYLPHFLAGQGLVNQLRENPSMAGRDAHVEKARQALRQSLETAPGFGPALASLGLTYLFEEVPSEEGLAVLREAYRLMPSDPGNAFSLALFSSRMGHHEEAIRVLQSVLGRGGDEEVRARARGVLAQIEIERARALLEEERWDDALAHVESVLASNTSEELRALLEPQVEAIRRTVHENKLVALYNRAITLANERRFEEAAKLLREVIERGGAAHVVDAARDALERLEPHL